VHWEPFGRLSYVGFLSFSLFLFFSPLSLPLSLSLSLFFSFSLSDLTSPARKVLTLRLEMKYIVAALYSNYTTSIIDDTDIEQSDAYTAPPKGGKLIVRLERRVGVM